MFQITLSDAKLKKLVVQGINQSDELDSFGVRRTKVESVQLGRLLKLQFFVIQKAAAQ